MFTGNSPGMDHAYEVAVKDSVFRDTPFTEDDFSDDRILEFGSKSVSVSIARKRRSPLDTLFIDDAMLPVISRLPRRDWLKSSRGRRHTYLSIGDYV